MKTLEKKLIKDFALKKFSRQDFLATCPIDFVDDAKNPLRIFERAYANKNAEDVEYSLLIGFLFNFFSNDYVDVLGQLIIEEWHFKHEDIASILQELKNPDSVKSLYEAALMKLDYLSCDDSYALARKYIHALGDINTGYSREKLVLISSSEIPIIREKAEKQLHYYKR